MNQITKEQFHNLNNEEGFEVLRSVVDGKNAYERACALYDYVSDHYESTPECTNDEQHDLYVKMQVMKLIGDFRKNAFPAFLSPIQLHYVTDLLIQKYTNNSREFTTTCVGIRHYPGTLRIGDIAELRREPQNRYDPNAIAVFRNNVQVGHIQRYDAAKFAPMMDKGFFIAAECVDAPDAYTYLMKVYVSVY